MNKKVFIIKLILFTLFACVIPFIFIAWRYDIFMVQQSSAKVSLTGWGFLGVIIIGVFVCYMYSVAKKIFKYSLFFQIITGLVKVILPLLLIYLVIDSIENSIHLFKQALVVVICSEIGAIVINPFPKYMHDNNIEHISDIVSLGIKKAKGE